MPSVRIRVGVVCGAALLVLGLFWGNSTLGTGAPCFAAEPAANSNEPEDEYEPFVVIQARKVITLDEKDREIENGMIVLAGGKVQSVGRALEYPLNARVIDATDRVVMPGLVNPYSRYGLDNARRSGVHGNLSVKDDYYPQPDQYDEIDDSGYTTLALVPNGSGIPGRAYVIRIAGPEGQRELVLSGYLLVTGGKSALRDNLKRAEKAIEKVKKAREEWEKKQAELKKKQEAEKKKQEAEEKQQEQKKGDQKQDDKPKPDDKKKEKQEPPATQPAFKPPTIDPAIQPLVDLIQKKEGALALLRVGRASDIVHLMEVLEEYEIAHAFVARTYLQTDMHRVVETLGKKKASVILGPYVGRLPHSAERINLPKLLADAGCEVSLVPAGDYPREFARTLGRVAELVRSGWSRAAALKAVTLHPAQLLGIDQCVGSIAEGKEADLIFLDADPLDPTARVRAVMIAGEMVIPAEDDD